MVLGVASAVVGVYISSHHDTASDPAIVLTGTVAFAVLAIGLPKRYRHNRTKI
jgi:ABC-type Mn2+/Zn2+ transport system permease subunit